MAQHATMGERVDYLEKLMGESADKHATELEALKAAHAKLANDHNTRNSKLSDLMAREKDAREGHHASVQERLIYLEKVVGDSADKHAAEIDALKAAHSKHATAAAKQTKDLESLKQVHEKHATLEERLNYVEKLLGDSADKHADEVEP